MGPIKIINVLWSADQFASFNKLLKGSVHEVAFVFEFVQDKELATEKVDCEDIDVTERLDNCH